MTRAVADAVLDHFVDGLASRLASFDKTALAAAKAQVNRASLPPDADLRAAHAEYVISLTWPGFQTRVPQFAQLAAEKGLDEVELRLGDYIGIASQQLSSLPPHEDAATSPSEPSPRHWTKRTS